MAHPVHAPRINNNDDVVKVAQLCVRVGDVVAAGQLVMAVETEKATIDVESDAAGHVLAILCEPGQSVDVGSVLLWLGASPEEPVPGVAAKTEAGAAAAGNEMTAKARLLMKRYRLDAALVPRAGGRLTAADVEDFVERLPAERPASQRGGARVSPELPAAAEVVALSPTARGMLTTVTWQRDHAVPAYLEIGYDPRPWSEAASVFMKERRLLFNPMLALMAHCLARVAGELGVNGTVLEDGDPRIVRYTQVNLGFTVQAGDVLYLCVAEAADKLSAAEFVARLFDLQRRAMGHKLTPAEMRGATVGFTSMARWGVQRHTPVLAPNTAVMVAHSEPTPERAVLGITYDHRLLSGFAAVRLLKKLVQPVIDAV